MNKVGLGLRDEGDLNSAQAALGLVLVIFERFSALILRLSKKSARVRRFYEARVIMRNFSRLKEKRGFEKPR
jgi:hypothetical protein